MKPSNIVKACAVVVISTVLCVCVMNFTSEDDATLISSSNRNITQNYNRTVVSSRASSLGKTEISTDPNLPGVPNSQFANEWLEWLDKCHKQMGGQGCTYVWGGYLTITHFDGNPLRVREDCSGYVGYALYSFGRLSSPTGVTSSTVYSDYGFTPMGNGHTMEELVAGDIVAWPGKHVQVYAGTDERGHLWYNWGGYTTTSALYEGVQDVNSVVSTTLICSRPITNANVYRFNP